MHNILVQGFLEKVAVSPEYIMKRLGNVHKQIRDMGVITRKGFHPGVRTIGKKPVYLLERPGSHRKWRLDGSDKASKFLLPPQQLSHEDQKLRNLLLLHHEKAEAQALIKRVDPASGKLLKTVDVSFSGHTHPSVIEREARMLERLRAKYPKAVSRDLLRQRLLEASSIQESVDLNNHLIKARRKDLQRVRTGESKVLDDIKPLSKHEYIRLTKNQINTEIKELRERHPWRKAYNYYSNI